MYVQGGAKVTWH